MRKSFFTLMLAIVSSVWMTSGALCLVPASNAMYQPFATVFGTFVCVPIPCEPIDEYPCPACLTLALQTSNSLYYLTTDNADIQTQLEAIEYHLSEGAGITGTVSGTPYTEGNYDYIKVSGIDTNDAPLRLNTLCDEWNIAKISNAMGPLDEIHTVKSVLGTDTIIQMQRYIKLFEAGLYKGALREGTNSDIYYIPSGSAHEYLLYNFNANVGDTLSNLWYGGSAERCPNGYNATVLSISEETPRVFTIEVEYIISDSDGDHIDPWIVFWTEGVGLLDGPAGQFCPGPDCACSCGQVVLCAYKNGEHIYTSALGEQYGCEYNHDPYLIPVDTIPLYVKDNSGSSTIDPIDPNQIIATLRGDMLNIKVLFSLDIINLSLSRTSISMNAPARKRSQKMETFQNEWSEQLIEEGIYTLVLTNPSWDYYISGTFDFYPIKEALEQTDTSTYAHKKLLRDGQILILRGNRTYTLTGQEVK